jgi:3-hydroxyisobutyrate dehydrogenase
MNIGIMGIGLMGHAFVERFISCSAENDDFTIAVYNRSPEKLDDLKHSGIDICDSAEGLIDNSQVIILMASDASAIDALLPLGSSDLGSSDLGSSDLGSSDLDSVDSGSVGSDSASFESAEPRPASLAGKTILQMATIAPQQSRDLSAAVQRCGGRYLEAPVLGSIPEAKQGSLIIMAGGRREVFDDVLPVLKVLGSAPRYIGEAGSAAALKLAMNQLIAALTAGFSLSLAYAMKNGVDTDLFMDTVRDSALYAKTYDKKLDKYLSRDFGTANFSTRHLLKDIRLFIEDAQTAGLDTDALEGIERITGKAVDSGMASMDYSSIFEMISPAE